MSSLGHCQPLPVCIYLNCLFTYYRGYYNHCYSIVYHYNTLKGAKIGLEKSFKVIATVKSPITGSQYRKCQKKMLVLTIYGSIFRSFHGSNSFSQQWQVNIYFYMMLCCISYASMHHLANCARLTWPGIENGLSTRQIFMHRYHRNIRTKVWKNSSDTVIFIYKVLYRSKTVYFACIRFLLRLSQKSLAKTQFHSLVHSLLPTYLTMLQPQAAALIHAIGPASRFVFIYRLSTDILLDIMDRITGQF